MTNSEDDNKTLYTGGLALLLGVVFDWFFFDQSLGAAFPVFVVLVVICGRFMSVKAGLDIPARGWLLIGAALFFSAMTAIRGSEMILLLDIFVTVYLLLWIIRTVREPESSEDPLIFHLLVMIETPFKFLFEYPVMLAGLFKQGARLNSSKKHAPLIRGVVIAVPILLLFMLLFSSADIVFNKYLTDFIDIRIDDNMIMQSIIIFIVTSVFLGAFGYLVNARLQTGGGNSKRMIAGESTSTSSNGESTSTSGDINDGPPDQLLEKPAGLVECIVVLSSVSALFLIFIAIQLTYLFGGQANITKLGFTYAEYARRGFFELMAVAGVAFFMLWVFEKISVRQSWSDNFIFKLLSTVFIGEVMLIIASSFKRLLLYEGAYGFTELRLYSHIFTVWLAIVFLLLLYKILTSWVEVRFINAWVVSALVVLGGMNLVNLDAFIVNKNMERFAKTGNLDIEYLATLSGDAVPGLLRTLDLKDEKMRSAAAGHLHWKLQVLKNSDGKNWHSYNVSRKRAINLLEANIKVLLENKDSVSKPFNDFD